MNSNSTKTQAQTVDVIEALQLLFRNEPSVKRKFENAFAAQPSSSPWHGKSLDAFYPFFSDWLKFDPLPKTAKQYEDEFKSFYFQPRGAGPIVAGLEAVRDEKFSNWLKSFVSARGAYLDSQASSSVVEAWVKENPTINLAQYIVPPEGYSSFNAFFTRSLKAGARPIDSPNDDSIVVSPADSMVWEDSNWLVDSSSTTLVKGDSYSLDSLVADPKVASRYRNGRGMIAFLNPENYHRFHSPVNGTVTHQQELDGLYFGSKGFVDYFHERRRSICELSLPSGGSVCMITVGIATISSVTLQTQLGQQVHKGMELGNFKHGGSAIVLLFTPKLLSRTLFDGTQPYVIQTATTLVGHRIGELI